MKRPVPSTGMLGILAALGACLATGCGAYRALEETHPGGPVWPPEEPRIRLHSTIDLQGGIERGVLKALHRLGDEPSPVVFQRPYSVAWAGNDLVVVDPDARRVVRIDPTGRIRFAPGGLFSVPIGVAACGAGVVVTDSASGRAALLDETLGFDRWLAGELARPTGVACRGDDVFVVETGRHRILRFRGGQRTAFGERGDEPGEFNYPTSIALLGRELLVGDAMNFRVQRFDADTGQYLGKFGRLGDAPGEMPRIKGIAVDSGGRVWVTDEHLDSVALYDLDGRYLTSLGESGSLPGQFSFPSGIAAHPDGRVVVVDSLNRRLQILKPIEPEEGGAG